MLFHQGIFTPENCTDPCVRALLVSASERAGPLLRPRDLLLSALRQANSRVTGVLSQSLQADWSWKEMFRVITSAAARTSDKSPSNRNREAISLSALKAIDALDATLREAAGALDGAALELFLHYVLESLDEAEREEFRALDARQASSLFRQKVEEAAAAGQERAPAEDNQESPKPAGHAREESILPPELGPAEDLSQRVRTGAAPAAYPFDGEPLYEALFEGLTRVLHRRRGNHVLLVGERGVGKSTVATELARRAAVGAIPFLQSKRFLAVDCRYVPPDESRPRLAALLDHVAARPDLVVVVDGFAALLRGERVTSNKPILLAALAHARCRFIGLVTQREFEEQVADDPDLAEFFTRIDVPEPDPETALKLLRHFAVGLAQKFQVQIDAEAVCQAVVLSANYILHDQLPAKAVSLLHRACEDVDYERSQQALPDRPVSVDDIVRLVSEKSGVPEETLRGVAERSDYEQGLRQVIFGQDHAVHAVATELGLIKAGMTDAHKPASVMLFLGQTGTGKTEMAKVLARFYSTSKRLKTYTLGNCVEPHSVATIIGVPPGYVGHDQGGRLVNDLNADPYCVFLLDEADKAHPDVLQPFLNLFDEGWVCDQRGVKAFADRAIFILTSNVGQRMIAELAKEGKGPDEITTRMKEAVAQIRHAKSERPVFAPEFLARLKRVIVFNPLDQAAMTSISQKLVREMQATWAERRGKHLEVPEALVRHVAETAHQLNEKSQGKEGGRIVRKLIADWIEAPLQRAVSQQPAEYRACPEVSLAWVPPVPPHPPRPDAPGEAPQVTISFRSPTTVG